MGSGTEVRNGKSRKDGRRGHRLGQTRVRSYHRNIIKKRLALEYSALTIWRRAGVKRQHTIIRRNIRESGRKPNRFNLLRRYNGRAGG